MTPLTADLCATAIVAAARSFGDDPVEALMSPRSRSNPKRRSLASAALAVITVTKCSRAGLCTILGIDYFGLSHVPKQAARKAAFDAALAALGVEPVLKAPTVAPPAPPKAVTETKPPIDHTDTIRDALRRRQASGVATAVVAIDAAKASATATGCSWPIGDPRSPDFRQCGADRLEGRMYCAEHLKAAGMKVGPRVIEVVGRIAQPYTVAGEA